MKTLPKEFKPFLGKPSIGIIVRDSIGEYDLTQVKFRKLTVTVREIYNEYKAELILESAGVLPATASDAYKAMLIKTRDNILNATVNSGAMIALPEHYDPENTSGTYYFISVYAGHFNITEKIYAGLFSQLLDILEEDALGISPHGDGDYYDYAPSYIDIFRQACQVLGQNKRYNKFVSKLDKDFVEDALFYSKLF